MAASLPKITMKINGKKIEGPNIEIIVIPRGDDNDIVFKAQAVLNRDDFDKLCPAPKPPGGMRPGGVTFQDVENPVYKQETWNHAQRYIDWLVIQSLKATEGLEWETVDYSNPDTWVNYRKELTDSGFSTAEVIRIVNGTMVANSLDENKLEAARKRFFTMVQAEKLEKLSQEAGQSNMQSGVLASG